MLAFIVLVHFVLVAFVMLRSLDMFRSVLGTWLPFALIYGATAATGWVMGRSSAEEQEGLVTVSHLALYLGLILAGGARPPRRTRGR